MTVSTRSRRWLSIVAGLAALIAAFLFLMAFSCNDVGGISSWERCSTAVGTPGFSVEDWGLDANLNLLIPVIVGLAVGVVAWWLTGLQTSDPN